MTAQSRKGTPDTERSRGQSVTWSMAVDHTLGLFWDCSELQECKAERPCAQKDSIFGLVLCCLKIINGYLTRSLVLSFLTRPSIHRTSSITFTLFYWCARVRARTRIYRYTYLDMCGEDRGWCSVSSSITFHIIYRGDVSTLSLELADSVVYRGSLPRNATVSIFSPSTRDCRPADKPTAFWWALGS